MKIKEIHSKSILSPSKIYDYVINPYVGCQHACSYANDEVRKMFEPNAPSIMERLRAIESLHQNGIRTYVMIAPILPEAENLIGILAGKVDYIIIDRMNYCHADKIYEKHGWREKNTDGYFDLIGNRIEHDCVELGVECRSAY